MFKRLLLTARLTVMSLSRVLHFLKSCFSSSPSASSVSSKDWSRRFPVYKPGRWNARSLASTWSFVYCNSWRLSPCQEPQLAGLWKKWWLSSKEGFTLGPQGTRDRLCSLGWLQGVLVLPSASPWGSTTEAKLYESSELHQCVRFRGVFTLPIWMCAWHARHAWKKRKRWEKRKREKPDGFCLYLSSRMKLTPSASWFNHDPTVSL